MKKILVMLLTAVVLLNLHIMKATANPIITKSCEVTYTYSYGKDKGCGTLNIFSQDGKFMCSIDANIGAPSYNMAIVKNKPCIIENNNMYCRPDKSDRKFEIIFHDKYADVKYVSGNWRGYFGWNATIEGRYWKTVKQEK